MKKFNYSAALGFTLLTVSMALVSAPSFAVEPLKGTVSLDGSSTVFPISEAVAEEFLALQPRVRVTVGVSGTGGGFESPGTPPQL